MKKHFSILLVLAVVFSMIIVPAKAAISGVGEPLNAITDGVFPTSSSKWIYSVDGNTVEQPTDGLGGKASDDAYAKITQGSKTGRAGLLMINKNKDHFSDNYLVYTASIYGKTPFSFWLTIGDRNVDVSADSLKADQWNEFVVVIDKAADVHTAYLNGVSIGTITKTIDTAKGEQLRLLLTDKTAPYYYIDDVAIYKSSTEPTISEDSGSTGPTDPTDPPEPSVPTKTAPAIIEQRSDAAGFTDSDAYNFDIDCISTAEYGIGGKLATDAVGKLTGEVKNDNSAETFFIRSNGTKLVGKNFAMSILVYPNSTIGSVTFATNSNKALSEIINTATLPEGEWSRLTIVHNAAKKESKLYINDVYKSSVTCAAEASLRILFNSTAASLDKAYIYYDDYILHSGDVSVPAITSVGSYVKENLTIHKYGKDTVATIKSNITTADTEYSLKVVGSDGIELADTATANDGCQLQVYDGEVLVSTYEFGVADYAISEDTKLASNGYISSSNKFAKGDITITRDIVNYAAPLNVLTFAAQYKTDGTMLKMNINPQTISGKTEAKATLSVTETEGTYIKFMIFDAKTLKPLATSATFNPFASDKIESAANLYSGYTTKSMVFNYDDSHKRDKELIDLLNTYGMKGTFNINSSRLIDNMKSYCAQDATDEQVIEFAKNLYSGHEIANHTATHPAADSTPEEDTKYGITSENLIKDINDCDTFAKENFGVNTIGLAWPNGPATRRDDYATYVLPQMQNNTSIKYARAFENGSFALPTDWYRWNSTCHHNDALYFADKFNALDNEGDLKCFFNWGHSYEFADNEGNDALDWTMIENVMKKLQGQNIWFATNGDIYNYVEATKKVEKTDTTIKNNSDMTLYYNINGVNVSIAPGATYSIAE